MKNRNRYHSYLVRLWREGLDLDRTETPSWQVEVIHIQTGKTWRFKGLEELFALLETLINQETV